MLYMSSHSHPGTLSIRSPDLRYIEPAGDLPVPMPACGVSVGVHLMLNVQIPYHLDVTNYVLSWQPSDARPGRILEGIPELWLAEWGQEAIALR